MPPKLRDIITYVFLFIVLITAVAAVLANLGLFGLDPNSNFAKTTLGAVLVEIVAAMILVWKTGILQPSSILAAIIFPDGVSPVNVDLDLDACFYEIRDMRAQVKNKDKLGVVWERGGWQCRLPRPPDPTHLMILRLTERNGTKWEVRPFHPLSREVKATKL